MDNYTLTTGSIEPKRSTAKVLIIVGGILVLLLMAYGLHGCFTAVESAQNQSRILVESLHIEMEQQDWSGIYANASEGYRKAIDEQKSTLYFLSIYKKLGVPDTTTLENTVISATTNGSFIRSVFQTKFSKGGTGTETIVWREDSDGKYCLYNYDIQSFDLVTK